LTPCSAFATSARLIYGRSPSSDVGCAGLNIGLRDGHCAHLGSDPAALITNLHLQRRLFGNRSLQRIAVRPVVDFEQEIPLFDKLVVAHIQTQNRAFHLRGNADKVGEYLAIIGSRMEVLIIYDHQA
jgi:hypothetical protein